MTQRIEHIIKNDSGGDAQRKDRETRKQILKQTEYAKEAEKVRKQSLLKQAGVSISLGGILKQSQVFTSTLGTVFQLLGAFVDVIMAPFLPVIVPAIKAMASLLPVISKWSRKVAEDAIPKIQEYMKPLYEGIKKVVGLQEGGTAQIGEWFVKLGVDIITKAIPALFRFNMQVSEWLWDKIVQIYNYLKLEFPKIQVWEDKVLEWWDKAVTAYYEIKTEVISAAKCAAEIWEQAKIEWKALKLGISVLKTVIPIRLAAIRLKIGELYDKFMAYWDWFTENLPKVIQGVCQTIKWLWAQWDYYVTPAIESTAHNINALMNWFNDNKETIWGEIVKVSKQGFKDVVAAVKAGGEDVKYKIENPLETLFGQSNNAFTNWLFRGDSKMGPRGAESGPMSQPGITGLLYDYPTSFSKSNPSALQSADFGLMGQIDATQQLLSELKEPDYLSIEQIRARDRKTKPEDLDVNITISGLPDFIGDHRKALTDNFNIEVERGNQGTFFGAFDTYGEESDYGFLR